MSSDSVAKGSGLDASVRAFLETLSGKTPTPGGGAASAVSGAIGAATILMAARYSRASKALATHADALDAFIEKLERSIGMLAALSDADAAAYDAYRAARKARGESPAGEAAFRAAVQKAAAVPLEIAAVCSAVLSATDSTKEKTTPHLISDLAGGTALVAGAVVAAAYNVRINLGDMDDKDAAERLQNELKTLLDHVQNAERSIADFAEQLL